MAKSNQKTPVVFRLGIILLCCMLFTTYLMGNLYARYTTTASGSDSARVAKFQITNKIVSTDSQAVNINLHFFDPTMLEDSLSLQVSSGSEVAVKYDVEVTMPDLPDGVDYSWLEIKLGEKTLTANGTVFTLSDVGTFTPNDSSVHPYELTFTIKAEKQGNPPAELEDISSTVTITVHAEQID